MNTVRFYYKKDSPLGCTLQAFSQYFMLRNRMRWHQLEFSFDRSCISLLTGFMFYQLIIQNIIQLNFLHNSHVEKHTCIPLQPALINLGQQRMTCSLMFTGECDTTGGEQYLHSFSLYRGKMALLKYIYIITSFVSVLNNHLPIHSSALPPKLRIGSCKQENTYRPVKFTLQTHTTQTMSFCHLFSEGQGQFILSLFSLQY